MYSWNSLVSPAYQSRALKCLTKETPMKILEDPVWLTLYSINTHFDQIKTRQFLKTLWEKEKFLLNQIIVSPCVHISDILSLFVAELEEPKIGRNPGKMLKHETKTAISKPLRHRCSFCDKLCKLYDVIYKTRRPTLFHTKHHQFSFIGNFHTFCHRNENDDGFVVLCGDLSFHWYIRTLEIGTYEQSYRGLNLEDRQFFSITFVKQQFRIC